VIINLLSDVYDCLKRSYVRMDPHHETWELWIKGNKTQLETFIVGVGTILVQNTNWINVDKAMNNLKKDRILSYSDLLKLNQDTIEEIIRPAGFYKQKANYLISLAKFLLERRKPPLRKELLKCKGVGKETADSILVYCFQEPVVVVGTYTRRFLARYYGKLHYLKKKYEEIQTEIQDNLVRNFEVFGRFHALIVCHCQNICQKNKPNCFECILNEKCVYAKESGTNSVIADIQKIIMRKSKKSRQQINKS